MPDVLAVALLALAGGVGAGCRFMLDGLIRGRTRSIVPLGTLVVHVTGSLMLGFVTGLLAWHAAAGSIALVVGTGLLGGYTTFSTASFETVQLVREREWVPALIAGPGMLVVTVAAAAGGLGLAALLPA